ncbi:type VI secretion system transmembrane protein TssO [Chryseobacterium capnotolerans]|uniref:type VI secretion system TssO n=1 Tax=Chryseobacterium timonianum TaxID=1805473 RepID=UPI00083B8CC4|nr:type VI secretion system TssO [Chryseobacterium timonianum]UHO37422.1 type VI secretion system transmembrane protein TssO [Chryseobacterium capnotolerans]
MSSNREKKLNKSDVRTGIWKFILSFVVLSMVSFSCLYLFFKSYDIQREGISREAEAYKELMRRSDMLKENVDEIYEKMTQLDLNKVENEAFLRTNIMDNVGNVKSIMGKDSITSFKHYSTLMKQIGPMLTLKTKIIGVEYKKKTVLRDLDECMGKVSRANNELRKDPTRNFTGGRRR